MKESASETIMIFKETKLAGAYVIELEKNIDVRGYFARTWCQDEFAAHDIHAKFLQSNSSLSHRCGTLRGLHYQIAPYEEIKLVRCVRGAIFDVIIDLRQDSHTYRQWEGVELSEDNQKMFLIPTGFAHGYQTLQDNTEVNYLVTQVFSPQHERGVRWNDPTFHIAWPEAVQQTISDKDQSWSNWTE